MRFNHFLLIYFKFIVSLFFAINAGLTADFNILVWIIYELLVIPYEKIKKLLTNVVSFKYLVIHKNLTACKYLTKIKQKKKKY